MPPGASLFPLRLLPCRTTSFHHMLGITLMLARAPWGRASGGNVGKPVGHGICSWMPEARSSDIETASARKPGCRGCFAYNNLEVVQSTHKLAIGFRVESGTARALELQLRGFLLPLALVSPASATSFRARARRKKSSTLPARSHNRAGSVLICWRVHGVVSASLAPSLVLAEPGTTQTAGTNRPEPGLDTPRPVVHTVEQFDKLCIYHETAASGFFVFGIFRRHPADATSPLSFLWLTMIAYACTYGDRPVVFLAPYVTFAVVDVSG